MSVQERSGGKRRAPLVPAALAAVLAACGSGDSPADFTVGPALPRRLRLTELPGRLVEPAPPSATGTAPLLQEDFDSLPEDWYVITQTKDVLDVDEGALERRIRHEGERSFLTLSGQGATYCVIPAEGDATYRFRGELRANDVRPAVEPFHGAVFWVAESARVGSPAELFAEGKRFDLLHSLPSAAGRSGWQERELVFRTRPSTRTLIVGCVLAVEEQTGGGTVDFDALRLERASERTEWKARAAEAVARAWRGQAIPPLDGRAGRRVDAQLGLEQRPALLLLPDESLEFELDVPAERPVFRAALGIWREGPRPLDGPSRAWLRIEGDAVPAARHELVADPGEARDLELDLAPFAGRTVRLSLGTDGPVPLVLGAPEVLARGPLSAAPNLILISIDTLRADRVGAYGATSGATPNLDRLARDGVLFEDMSANAPYTLPAHASLLSGQFPSVHGVEDQGRFLSPERSALLTLILADRGYRTQAFVAGGFLTPDFGFHTGFDGFSVLDPFRHPDSRYFDAFRRQHPGEAVPGFERVRSWLSAHAAEPFFLFLHTYEVHDYDPPPGTVDCAARGCTSTLSDYHTLLFPRNTEPFPGSEADRAHVGHLYDAALRHVDAQLGTLLEDLERLGLAARTLVVVTSDHGEELFERGHLQHGKTLYGEQLRIPLVLRIPGRPPARIERPAMQVDLLPTLLDVLGLAVYTRDERIQGLDLLAYSGSARPLWAEVDDHFTRKTSLRDGSWKLVHGPTDADVRLPSEREWELYDLADDPGERHDRAGEEPATLERLQRLFEAFGEHLARARDGLGPVQSGGQVDAETLRQLEELGYVGSRSER